MTWIFFLRATKTEKSELNLLQAEKIRKEFKFLQPQKVRNN